MLNLIRGFILSLVITSAAYAGSSTLLGVGKPPASGPVTVCGSGWTGPTSGLTHCWPLDSAHVSGTTIQDAIGSINGTADAAVGSGTGPSGVSNSARTYNGTLGSIALASEPMPSQPLTVATWVNLTTGVTNDGGDARLICFASSGVTSAVFATPSLNPPNYVDMTVTGATESTATVAVSVATWHHYAMTYNGTSMLFYYDGVLTANAGAGIGNACDFNAWVLGGRNNTGRLWAGSQATTVVYNRVLSSTEITSLFNAF